MAENTEKPDLPGLDYAHFKAGVDAVVDLRDRGEFLPFLSRGGRIRLIGSPESFRSAFSRALDEESVDEKTAQDALAEIGNFLAAYGVFRDPDALLRFLEDAVFDEEFESLPDEGKNRFRSSLRDKASLVVENLFTPAMEQRANRIETASGSVLEDLDVEIVTQRRDELLERRLSTPFLRMRLRYTDGTSGAFPFPGGWGKRWTGTQDIPKSFEFEGDEADIDLILKRLLAAKQLLIDAVERETRAEG